MNILKRMSFPFVITYIFLIVIFSVLNLQGKFDPILLLPILNTLFAGILSITVAVFSAIIFLKTGNNRYLFMCCAFAVIGLGAILAGWMRFLPGGTNVNVTIYNSSLFIGAFFHLLAAIREEKAKKRRIFKSVKKTLIFAVLGICAFIVLLVLSVLLNIMPLFYNQNGFTMFRQTIYTVVIVLYFSSSMLFLKDYQRQKADFLYWYSISLAMITVGLFGIIPVQVVGGYISWLCRCSLYIGSLFALFSILTVYKEAKVKGMTINRIMSEYFADDQTIFKRVVETSNDGIISVDQNFNILYINPAAERMYGIPYSKAVNTSFTDRYVQERYKALLQDDIKTFIDTGTSILEGKTVEIEAVDSKRRKFPIEISTAMRVLPTGCVCTYIIRDITERKHAEEHILDLLESLRQADKNKNEFLSILSHELRNPLATIVAGLSLLDISDDNEQKSKAQEVMRRQIDQLCHLVDDLLDLTRITQNKIVFKMERVDLNKLALSTLAEQKMLFEEKEVNLEAEINEEDIYIYIDPVRIKQSIENLLHNAMKFTNRDGTVKLSVFQDKNNIVISVKDNGIGIESKLLPKIFQAFIQSDTSLDRQNGGLGLGLSIVKGISEQHGGSVSAFSDGVGKGAEFNIYLPFNTDDSNKDVEKCRT